MLGMNRLELSRRQMGYLARDVLDEVCEVHGCQLFGKAVPSPEGGKYLRFCPVCTQEGIDARNQELASQTSALEVLKQRKNAIFHSLSKIPWELEGATFANYDCPEAAAKLALDFTKRATRHYFTGGDGNVIMTGQPGVGKSHLAISMLRCLNEQHGLYDDPKSCVFMPTARLFSDLKAAINTHDTEVKANVARLKQELIACDYLVLDDLGKESSYSLELKRANEWVQSILFEILDSRRRTIITTNFYPEQLQKIYDPALFDRVFKGDRSLRHRMGETLTSRRS